MNPDLIKVMLEEYKTLRQESLTTMITRPSILSFGMVGIAAAFTGGIKLWPHPIASALLFALGIPLVVLLIVVLWFGEYRRMQRAGLFLVDVEKKINTEAGRNLLTWETELREKRRHMRFEYYVVPLIFGTISLASFIIGVFCGFKVNLDKMLILPMVVIVIGMLLHCVAVVKVLFDMSSLRQ